jgi:hypothetical protein
MSKNKLPEDQQEWLDLGIRKKWCSEMVCDTHQGVPRSDNEWQEWDDGSDPCAFVVRLDSWE